MKIGIFLDNNGHFRAINILNKNKILNTMHDFDGGDMWANEWHYVYNQYFSILANQEDMLENTWKNFLNDCTQRGIFEIVTI